MEWELAEPSTRDEAIRDAIEAIEQIAIPYFAKFENLPSLFQLLTGQEVEEMMINRIVEFLMCFADQPTARLAAANFLKRRPDLVQAYEQSYRSYAENGLSADRPSGYAEKLAFASHLFKFGDLRQAAP